MGHSDCSINKSGKPNWEEVFLQERERDKRKMGGGLKMMNIHYDKCMKLLNSKIKIKISKM